MDRRIPGEILEEEELIGGISLFSNIYLDTINTSVVGVCYAVEQYKMS